MRSAVQDFSQAKNEGIVVWRTESLQAGCIEEWLKLSSVA